MSADLLADRLQRAVALHARGQFAEAMALYGQIITADPSQPDALHLLGVALTQCGDARRGAEVIERSLRVNPLQPVAAANLGNAWLALERYDAALASFDRSIALSPTHALAHNGRGSALAALGRTDEALASFDRALELLPGFLEAHNNRGAALLKLKRAEAALEDFCRVLALRPDDTQTLTNRAAAMQLQQRHAECLADCDRALRTAPDLAEAQYLRAAALYGLGLCSEALRQLERMAANASGQARAWLLRGHVLRALGRDAAALAAYRQAVGLDEGLTEAQLFIGSLETSARRFELAAAAFEQVLRLDPAQPYVRGALLHAQLQQFEWRDYAASAHAILAEFDAGDTPDQPISFLALSDSPHYQLLCARRTQERRAVPGEPPATVHTKPPQTADGRIRIAYVSADFLEHPMAYLMAGVFEAHDRNRFEVIAISLRADEYSPTAARLKGAFDEFIDMSGRSDADISTLIRGREIDIAVDLMGCTAEERPAILRGRPATVQVSYIGFPGTTAAPHIDYAIVDEFVVPPGYERYFSEHLVYLPDSFQANDARRMRGTGGVSRADAGLPEAGFVWCSFHGSFKINPPLFDVWARLLIAVPGSVLWLVAASVTAQANLRREAERRGVDPQRLIFAARVPYPLHLARLGLADLCLDTWPFNGGATSSDALWMGLPVVTCAGRAFASRMTGSLLRTLGVPELITDDFAAYEALAVHLARDPDALKLLRAKLAANRHTAPLFDTARFTRHLETAYTCMWERQRRGERAATIRVADTLHAANC